MSEKLRVLVVGVGSIGQRHVRCLQQTGQVEVRICEPMEVRRQEVAAEYQIQHSYASLEAALDHAVPFQAAVICTPAHLHLPMAQQLANAGVHLLIEKPLSVSEAGLRQLQHVVQQHDVVVGVAYVYRYHPALIEMRSAIQSGRFGRPLQLVATCGQHFPTYRPAYRETYYVDRATGGGAVQDALTHVVNAGEWLVGPIDRLAADLAHRNLPGVTVEDTVHVLARHGDVLGCYSLNQHQAPNETTISVMCEQGTARFEYHHHRWRWMDDPLGDWHDESLAGLQRDELFTRQAADFVDAVRRQRSTSCTLDEAIHTMRVNLAILDSASTGRWCVLTRASDAS